MTKNKNLYYNNKPKKIYIYIFIIIILVSGLLIGLNYFKVNSYYIKVGDEKLSYSEYQFFYNLNINKIKSEYSDYLDYMDVDFSKDLSTQKMGDSTWEEYLTSITDMDVYKILALYSEANKNNFEYDINDDINSFIQEQKQYCASLGLTYSEYIKNAYDKNITENMIKKCLKYYFVSNLYASKYDNDDLSDEQFENYYKSHKDELDVVEYGIITMPVENKSQITSIKENISNIDDFKNAAIENQNNDGITSVSGFSNCNSLYSNWLFNAKNDEMNIFEDDSNVYLIYKIDRHRNNQITKNVCYLKTDESEESYEKLKNVQNEFLSSDKTKDSFISLAKENNVEDYEYIENLTIDKCSQLISIWLFDDERKNGDNYIFKDGDNYYYVLYLGDGLETYKAKSISTIKEGNISSKISSVLEKYTFIRK